MSALLNPAYIYNSVYSKYSTYIHMDMAVVVVVDDVAFILIALIEAFRVLRGFWRVLKAERH